MNPIECQGLTKRYGSTNALDEVTLSLPAGEPIALIGPNGAGKTTLLSTLCGFVRPSEGQATVFGHAPASSEISGRISALPQDALLDPRSSVGRQLKFFARLQGIGRSDAQSEVNRVLKLVDLESSIHTKPSDLSHGMRKRIAIAQALIGSPELVLLDEPTAGIDPPNAKMIRDLIREQSGNITFVVSSHNLDELERLCSTVVYMEKGRLVSVGSVADDDNHDVITLRMGSVPEEQFLEAVSQLAAVDSVSKTGQGDFLVKAADDMAASLSLMQLFAENQWRYRQMSRGKSLEERLYGSQE